MRLAALLRPPRLTLLARAAPQGDCELNSFCAWDPVRTTCAEAPEEELAAFPTSKKGCANGRHPTKLVNGRMASAQEGTCARFINEPVFVERVQPDPATMFYHWWRYFKEVR